MYQLSATCITTGATFIALIGKKSQVKWLLIDWAETQGTTAKNMKYEITKI